MDKLRRFGAACLLGCLFLGACAADEKAEPVEAGELEDAATGWDAAGPDAAAPQDPYGDGCASGDPFDGCHANQSVNAFRWLVPAAGDVVFAFADADTVCMCAGNALSLRKVSGQVLWEYPLPGKACRTLFCDASTGDVLLGGDVYQASSFVQRFSFDGEPGEVLVELASLGNASFVEIIRLDAHSFLASLTVSRNSRTTAGIHKFSSTGEALWAETLLTPSESFSHHPLHMRPRADGSTVFTVGSERGAFIQYEVSSEGRITSTQEEELSFGVATSFTRSGPTVDGRYVLAAKDSPAYRFDVYAKDGTLKWSHHERVGDPTIALNSVLLLDDDSVVVSFASLQDSTMLLQRVTEQARGESVLWDLKFRNLRQSRGWAMAMQRREIPTEDIVLGIELDDLAALVPGP